MATKRYTRKTSEVLFLSLRWSKHYCFRWDIHFYSFVKLSTTSLCSVLRSFILSFSCLWMEKNGQNSKITGVLTATRIFAQPFLEFCPTCGRGSSTDIWWTFASWFSWATCTNWNICYWRVPWFRFWALRKSKDIMVIVI